MAVSEQSQSPPSSSMSRVKSSNGGVGNDSDDPNNISVPSTKDEEFALDANEKLSPSRAVSDPPEEKFERDIEGKPVMLRAKRIISFDDQTSRLSRSKLVVV